MSEPITKMQSSLHQSSTSASLSSPFSWESLFHVIASFPSLLQQEDQVTKTPFDVMVWWNYLAQIDSILEEQHHQHPSSSSSSPPQLKDESAIQQQPKTNSHVITDNNNNTNKRKAASSDSSSNSTLALSLHHVRCLVGQRACTLLPGSYKLWKNHLEHLLEYTTTSTTDAPPSLGGAIAFSIHYTRHVLEVALIRLHKYPTIWCLYLEFAMTLLLYKNNNNNNKNSNVVVNVVNGNVTELRRLINRCFMALPVPQHDKVWPIVLSFFLQQLPTRHPAKQMLLHQTSSLSSPYAQRFSSLSSPLKHHQHQQRGAGVGGDGDSNNNIELVWDIPSATILALVKRYVQLHPLATEALAELYVEFQQFGPAALVYQDLLQPSSSSSSSRGNSNNNNIQTTTSTRHALWTKFCQLCTQHPQAILKAGIDFEAVIRSTLPSSKQQQQQQLSMSTEEEMNDMDSKPLSSNTSPLSTTASFNPNNTTTLVSSSEQEMEGTLWIYLAHYYLHQGELDMARTILGEALENVTKVRDFSLVFEAYLQLEETILDALMNDQDDMEQDDADDDEGKQAGNEQEKKKSPNDDDDDDPDWDILLGDVVVSANTATSQDVELELALARAEYITGRRPLLLNQVLLKQNPHNVGHWLQRADLLLQQQPAAALASDVHQQQQQQQANVGAVTSALEESLQHVSARQAINGRPSQLVLRLASLYETNNNNNNNNNSTITESAVTGLELARRLFRRICQHQEYLFHKVEDLAECFVAWVEMELRQEQWEEALSIVRQALSPVSSNTTISASTTLDAPRIKLARALTKSLRLWDLWLDLEESLGSVQTTKDAYYQALEQKVATPLHVLNFASFLLEHQYFEEAFTVYERGIDLFAFPHASAKLLWKAYLQAFSQHFLGTKLARTRDLWTRCLESCPPAECAEFYLMCGEFEEEYGLTQRALNVYHDMCQKVPTTAEKLTAYQLYIAKTTQYVGLTATRAIYQEAIAALTADDEAAVTKLCLEFTKMETSLQEFDRARAILVYGAQFADPRRRSEYWQAWNEFEILQGNEETFREMLRVRKSVEAMYSTINYNAAEMSASSTVANLTDEQALNMIASQEGVELPSGSSGSSMNNTAAQSGSAVQGFVKASSAGSKRSGVTEQLGDVEERVAKLRKVTAQAVAAAAATTGDDDDDDNDDDDKVQPTDDAEIDIDDLDDDDDDDENEEGGDEVKDSTTGPATNERTDEAKKEVKNVTTKAVPEAVFGGLAASSTDVTEAGESLPNKMGALERLRAAAQTTAAARSERS